VRSICFYIFLQNIKNYIYNKQMTTQIVISSKYRTLDSRSTSDFTFSIGQSLEISRVTIKSISVPNSQYNINSYTQTLQVLDENEDLQTIKIPVGQYSVDEFLPVLQSHLITATGDSTITVTLDPQTLKLIIEGDGQWQIVDNCQTSPLARIIGLSEGCVDQTTYYPPGPIGSQTAETTRQELGYSSTAEFKIQTGDPGNAINGSLQLPGQNVGGAPPGSWQDVDKFVITSGPYAGEEFEIFNITVDDPVGGFLSSVTKPPGLPINTTIEGNYEFSRVRAGSKIRAPNMIDLSGTKLFYLASRALSQGEMAKTQNGVTFPLVSQIPVGTSFGSYEHFDSDSHIIDSDTFRYKPQNIQFIDVKILDDDLNIAELNGLDCMVTLKCYFSNSTLSTKK
jgi:hypothetical protein